MVESGAGFVVAVFSFRTAIDPVARTAFERRPEAAGYDLDRPEREMLDVLERAGIETINLNDALRAYYREAASPLPLYFEMDGHFNERGHAVVADALAESLGARLGR